MSHTKLFSRRFGAAALTILMAISPLAPAATVYADDSYITESNYVLPDPNEGLEEDLANGSDIGSNEPSTGELLEMEEEGPIRA